MLVDFGFDSCLVLFAFRWYVADFAKLPGWFLQIFVFTWFWLGLSVSPSYVADFANLPFGLSLILVFDGFSLISFVFFHAMFMIALSYPAWGFIDFCFQSFLLILFVLHGVLMILLSCLVVFC